MKFNSVILITRTKITDWPMNTNIFWQSDDYSLRFDPYKMRKVEYVFIYFAQHGLSTKGRIISLDIKKKKLEIILEKTLTVSLKPKDLIQLKIIPKPTALQGSKKYLPPELTNILIDYFNKN